MLRIRVSHDDRRVRRWIRKCFWRRNVSFATGTEERPPPPSLPHHHHEIGPSSSSTNVVAPISKWRHRIIEPEQIATKSVENTPKSDDFRPQQILLVPRQLHEHLFGGIDNRNQELLSTMADEKDSIESKLELPRLHVNGSLMEHFRQEASQQFKEYDELLQKALEMLNQILRRPRNWSTEPGWTQYQTSGRNDGPSRRVPFPDEQLLFFDVEVCMKDGRLPTMAIALSPTNWYSWCSERLADEHFELPELVRPEHLIPMGHLGDRARLIIGHNVAFDRTFIREQYSQEVSALRFWDTMSMHIAIAGMADHQRDLYKMGDDLYGLAKLYFAKWENPQEGNRAALEVLSFSDKEKKHLGHFKVLMQEWKDRTCKNSLEAIHNKYFGRVEQKTEKQNEHGEEETEEAERAIDTDDEQQPPIKGQLLEWDKKYQSMFKTAEIAEIRENTQVLFNYCASDVLATLHIFEPLYRTFYYRFPHPVTHCGMLEMGNPYLPITGNWRRFFAKCEMDSSTRKNSTTRRFIECTRELIAELDTDAHDGLKKFELDPWLWVADWNRPPKRPEWPQWHYTLFKHFRDASIPIDELSAERVKMLSRDIPRIFGLCYGPYPLYHKMEFGWGFLVPNENSQTSNLPEAERVQLRRDEIVHFPVKAIHDLIAQNRLRESDVLHGKMKPVSSVTSHFQFYRLPHPSGKACNVGTPFDKSNYKSFEQRVLYATRFEEALELFLDSRSITRFWTNYRDRYNEELAVWLDEQGELGAIVPSVTPAGTVTRRATHKLWLTSANPKDKVIGSDLKSMVQCTDGWKLVGADVDSQEQWLAALFGDSLHESKRAGATAFSNMLLAGNKADRTDLHSVVAKQVGIQRDHAKTLNYARLYGSGHMHAEQFLVGKGITQAAAKQTTKKLFDTTKGKTANYIQMTPIGAQMLAKFVASKGNGAGMSRTDETIRVIGGRSFVRVPYNNKNGQNQKSHKTFVDRFEEWMLGQWESMEPKPAGKPTVYSVRKMAYENRVRLYSNGFESHTFNWLELNSALPYPTTPVLQCRLSRALERLEPCVMKDIDGPCLDRFNGLFKRTIINWFVQSSAVDFLHLLLVCMQWLCREYNIPARYVISIHDEVRYMVPEEDRFRCALALTMSNMYVRAAISEALGIRELPRSIAFFSQVDIDSVLRKEVSMECRTPDGKSVEKGEALNIEQIVAKTGGRLSKQDSQNS